ncbi:MAG: phosphosulfolactate synthase [Streptosporangiaceae bacterium]
MADIPAFLSLPERSVKPRARGITHVLDSGLTPVETRSFMEQAGHLADIVKVGWGIGYVDRMLGARIGIYSEFGCPVCLGGTLLEVAAMQDRVAELRNWALGAGITHVEVSNGLAALPEGRKHALVRQLAEDFIVLAETGSKDESTPVDPAGWAAEMADDLDAGATWVIAEGRESGTVGLYRSDHGVRDDVVATLLSRIPQDKVIFEAPTKNQQTWFIRQLGADANLGNVAPASVLSLETLRLGLRADTALVADRSAAVPPAAPARSYALLAPVYS